MIRPDSPDLTGYRFRIFSAITFLFSFKDVNESNTDFCSPEIVPEETLKNYIGDVDEKGKYFRWTYKATQSELIQSLK